MSTAPKSRPKQSRDETIDLLEKHGFTAIGGLILVGIRGYYKNSMGAPNANDIDIYDDALLVISPDTYKTFNFNTDPSKHYGQNAAMLLPGTYPFYKGKHHGRYDALRPYPEGVGLPCTRNGVKSVAHDTNIHMGGYNETGSAGCQTIYKPQYQEAMILTIYPQMTKYAQKTVQYLLVEA